jgi:hypothetical protein
MKKKKKNVEDLKAVSFSLVGKSFAFNLGYVSIQIFGLLTTGLKAVSTR